MTKVIIKYKCDHCDNAFEEEKELNSNDQVVIGNWLPFRVSQDLKEFCSNICLAAFLKEKANRKIKQIYD